MRTLFLVVLTFVAAQPWIAGAETNKATASVGDELILRMTGEIATEYARCLGLVTGNGRVLEIETSARIEQRLANGRIRVEHSARAKGNEKAARMVTLSATVDAFRVARHVIPEGAQIYASPGSSSAASKVTSHETITYKLELSELKDVKLRTWTLAEEIGAGG